MFLGGIERDQWHVKWVTHSHSRLLYVVSAEAVTRGVLSKKVFLNI